MKNYKVALADAKLEKAYLCLNSGDYEDRRLKEYVDRAPTDLKRDPYCGTHSPQRLIPKAYRREFGVENLWKYDLPNGWRLLYHIHAADVFIIAIVLEWLDHTGYERRFGY